MNISDIINKSSPLYKQKEMSKSEYKKIVDRNTELIDKMKYQEEEIERLNNIIKKLEKYLNEQIQKSWEIEEQCYEDIENKLHELKGSDKEC